MTDKANVKRRGPIALGEIVGGVLRPVTARRGFATADLVAAWPEVVGARFADITRPERIAWPRGSDKTEGAVLHLRVQGPQAILVQHELGQIAERVNAFLGYAAIARIRLMQAPVATPQARTAAGPSPNRADDAHLDATLSGVSDDALRAALDRLGRGVLSRR